LPADARAAFLERWLVEVVGGPGLTGISDPRRAREVLLNDALRALPLVEGTVGPIVDVGSGGGSPGIPLATHLPGRDVALLEAERRKCAFLERFASELPNVRVVAGRAEEQPLEAYGLALAKALAKPPVAAELCLPLVEVGGHVLLWVGPSADLDRVARVSERLGGRLNEERPSGILSIHKVTPTPPGFPRRPGMAKKRPLT
jgi:16S rRNA (guanine527-N7)-methyltransferase